jgi:hypothetical protein
MTYIKPETTVVKLQTQTVLQSGSYNLNGINSNAGLEIGDDNIRWDARTKESSNVWDEEW